MRPLTYCLSAIVLLIASAALHADAKSDAVARAKAIAPFVEAETSFVGRLDLTRMDPQAALDVAARLVPMPPDRIGWAKKESVDELKTAIQAGVKEIYVVVTSGNQGWLPRAYGIIPMLPGASEESMRKALKAPADYGRFVEGAYVVPFPPCLSMERAPPEFRPVERPELAEAFEATGDSAVQVILTPPSYARRIVEELIPQFPKELGGGSTTVLTRGICWAAAGIELPPSGALKLVIKSESAEAAESLRAKLVELMRLGGESKAIRDVVPNYDDVTALLAPKAEGDRLAILLEMKDDGFGKVLSAMERPIELIQAGDARHQSMRNLMHIGLAMHNFYQSKKHFPLPVNRGPDGKALLSWRVYILPYIDQDALFKQFHLDEPWDSPHNRTLIDKMPWNYRLPMSKAEPGRTNYLLPVGDGAVFDADKPTEFKDIKDGTSNTIMVVEVDDQHAVVWTKPEDWQFDSKDPAKGLGCFYNNGFYTAFCDGSAHFFSWPKEPKEIERLRRLFMRADGKPIEW